MYAPVVDGVDVAVGLLLGARVHDDGGGGPGGAALPAVLVAAVLEHAGQGPGAAAKDLRDIEELGIYQD